MFLFEVKSMGNQHPASKRLRTRRAKILKNPLNIGATGGVARGGLILFQMDGTLPSLDSSFFLLKPVGIVAK
jgi:hypothetical protein